MHQGHRTPAPLGATKSAAFFDLDKTVISRASVGVFLRVLHRHGLLPWSKMLRIGAVDLAWLARADDAERLEAIKESLISLVQGRERDEVEALVKDALSYAIEPLLFAEALDLMATHRQRGERLYLVSAAPAEIVGPLADLLGVDGWIASSVKVNAEGRYEGAMDYFADGLGKAEAVASLAEREGIDLSASYAYSDAIRDLPLLELVGNPVAVNPDSVLSRTASTRGWEVRRFSAPSRISQRVGVPNRLMVVAGLGAVGIALALLGRSRQARRGI